MFHEYRRVELINNAGGRVMPAPVSPLTFIAVFMRNTTSRLGFPRNNFHTFM